MFQERQGRIVLALTVTAPYRRQDGVWVVKANVILRRGGNPEINPYNVDFYRDNTWVVTETTDNGEAVAEIILPTPGAYIIRATVEELRLRQSRNITLAAVSRIPNDLEVRTQTNPDGTTWINATVVDQSGKGVMEYNNQHVVVRVMRDTVAPLDYEVDNNGVVSFSVKTEKHEGMELIVLGTSINKQINLLGPRTMTPRYKPLTSEEFKNMSTWDVVKAALKGGKPKR